MFSSQPKTAARAPRGIGLRRLFAPPSGVLSLFRRAAILGAGSFILLGIVLIATSRSGDPPTGVNLSQDPLLSDYVASVTGEARTALGTTYEAQTAFWQLIPSTWRADTEWRLTFLRRLPVADDVLVNGLYVYEHFPAAAGQPELFLVPSSAIGAVTNIVVDGPSAATPQLTLHWLGGGGTLPTTTAPVWWRQHTIVIAVVVALYLLLFGLTVAWAVVPIQNDLASSGLARVFLVVLLGIVVAACLTTNFDIQLFKGLAQGYWLNGPLPALALNGYGPIGDLLFTVPMLPYVLLAAIFGAHSELALNLAIRLPFIAGWLLLMAAFVLALRALNPEMETATRRSLWMALLLNPIVLLMTLWQPEALLVSLVLLSTVMIFQNRPVASGLLFGAALAGKYWPAFVGPILLISAWRLAGRAGALKWMASAAASSLSLFAVYWLPTLAILGSLHQFIAVAGERLPYFGGGGAAAQATVWSFYALPKQFPASAGVATVLEQRSFLLIMVGCLGIAGLLLRATKHKGSSTRAATIVAVGGALALVAGLNSLTVPQFALWSIPFILLAAAILGRPKLFVALGLAATFAGAAVSLFVEPISFWFLHISHAQDAWASGVAVWLSRNIVNASIAQTLGFFFTVFLIGAGALLAWELVKPPALAHPTVSGPGQPPRRLIVLAAISVAIAFIVLPNQPIGFRLLIAAGLWPLLIWLSSSRQPNETLTALGLVGISTAIAVDVQAFLR
jgi:hypothetical protein